VTFVLSSLTRLQGDAAFFSNTKIMKNI